MIDPEKLLDEGEELLRTFYNIATQQADRIEALEAALRGIADEQKVYKGHGDYDILPAMTACEAMMRARVALDPDASE